MDFFRKLKTGTSDKMKDLIFSQSAKDDIAEITGYFLPLNEQAANNIYHSILDTAEKIATFPLIGGIRPELGEGPHHPSVCERNP